MTTVTNTSILTFNSDGLMSFYLGYNSNFKIVTTTLLLQKTNVYTFAVPYNLSFDTYYNLIFNNIQSETKNNNNSQSDFKLPINSLIVLLKRSVKIISNFEIVRFLSIIFTLCSNDDNEL